MNAYSIHSKSVWTFYLLLASFLHIPQVKGQLFSPFLFKRYTVQQGLSSNAINAVLEDSHGFLWIGTSRGLNRYDGKEFRKFYYNPYDSTGLSGNYITALFEDKWDNLWVGVYGNGLLRYDPTTETFYPLIRGELTAKETVLSMAQDSAGILWIGTAGSELHTYDVHEDTLFSFSNRLTDSTLHYPGRTADIHVEGSHIWFATRSGISKWDGHEKKFNHYTLDNPKSRGSIAEKIHIDLKGDFWIGTKNGLVKWNPTHQLVERYYPTGNSDNYEQNDIRTIWSESEQQLWIGTPKNFYLFNRQSHTFTKTHPTNQFQGFALPYNANCFYQDRDQTLWIATENGLYQWNPQNRHMLLPQSAFHTTPQKFCGMLYTGDTLWTANCDGLRLKNERNLDSLLLKVPLRSIFRDKRGYIYVGGYALKGFYQIHPRNFQIKHFPMGSPGEMDHPIGGTYTAFAEDHHGYIWISTLTALNRFDPRTGRFWHIKPNTKIEGALSGYGIMDLVCDQTGNLWIATHNGLNKLEASLLAQTDTALLKFERFTHSYSDPSTISSNIIRALLEDKKGNIWIGTESGLNRYDAITGKFIRYQYLTVTNGGLVNSLREDKNGALWIGLAHTGLLRYNPALGLTTHFGMEEGLYDQAFLPNSCTITPDGSLLFASKLGINHFHPDSLIRSLSYLPKVKVRLTALRVNNSLVKIGAADSILKKSITFTKHIELQPNHHVFSLEFSDMQFSRSPNSFYQYKLEGYDQDWQTLKGSHEVTYTNLNPGKYLFRIKATTHLGIIIPYDTQLEIHILPPWWNTVFAQVIYVLLGSAFIIGLYIFQLRQQLAYEEAKHYKKLDTLKNELFANISHEFRTPLGIISGLSKEIPPAKPVHQNYLNIIQRNTHYLLDLVDQMLSLSRWEAGTLVPTFIQDDIIRYVRYLYTSFEAFAQTRHVNMKFETHCQSVEMDYDPELLRSIFFNLISNAIKYTPEDGDITISLDRKGHQFIMTVKDSGIGIPQDQIPHIFNKFYRSTHSDYAEIQGTGIGLALTKQLVEMHEGTIEVKSEQGKGSKFTIRLPIRRQASLQSGILLDSHDELSAYPISLSENVIMPQLSQFVDDDEIPSLLIIEDNTDVAYYLSTALHQTYRMIFAHSGKQGVALARTWIPDLVICDIMMPGQNGLDVCNELKCDDRTNHIPIILLTARADQLSKYQGLEKGADQYIQKPFDKEELLLTVENLIANRKKLFTKFRELSSEEQYLNLPLKNVFIKNMLRVLKSNFQDPQFEVKHLYKEMGMSKTQFYRKMREEIGEHISLSNIIHTMRANKGKELLLNTDLTINQIALEVGYKDHSTFTRNYKKIMGETPSETRNSRLK